MCALYKSPIDCQPLKSSFVHDQSQHGDIAEPQV